MSDLDTIIAGLENTLRHGNRRDELQDREIRRLRSRLEELSSGRLIRTSALQGVAQPSNGGTGIVGSPLGVSMWLNGSGGTRSKGYVVVAVLGTDRTFDDTTSATSLIVLGVLDDDGVIAGANGRVRHIGYQSVVNVQGNVTAGHYLTTSTTAGRAVDVGATPVAGAFALALTAYGGGGAGQVAAFVFPPISGGSTAQPHLLSAVVDVTAPSTTVPYILVGPMPAAGTITGVEAAADENLTNGATSSIFDVHLIPAANVNTDGQGTTIFTTQGNRPTISNGNKKSTTTAPDVTAFAAGDYFAIYTDQQGTTLTYATVGIRCTMP